jgi:hypothetical protein
MTPQIAPFVLLGMDGLLFVGGVWLLTHAFKTWRIERRQKDKAPSAEIRNIRERKPLPERFPTIAKSA